MATQEELAQAKLQAAAQLILPFVVAVQALRRSDQSPAGVIAGGTGCLVDTGRARLVLTAKHVADEISTSGGIGIVCGHGTAPIDISSWQLIDSDSDVDIETFAILDGFSPSSINKEFYVCDSWPESRATRGELAGTPSEAWRSKSFGCTTTLRVPAPLR